MMDDLNYLRFLTTLRQKLNPDTSLSMPSLAWYWFPKALPIDRISKVVGYMV
jgi:hypothetical protein